MKAEAGNDSTEQEQVVGPPIFPDTRPIDPRSLPPQRPPRVLVPPDDLPSRRPRDDPDTI
jgi:hypothetical protein